MLKENIKTLRKAKGLSQEELAIKLNVVRQTISKWEQGLSVPDAEMLISLSEVLETPVSTLIGETVTEPQADNFFALVLLDSPYLNWDYGDPEIAVVGVAFHAFEWIFVRVSPFVFAAALAGAILTRKKP